jgi:hypothetical protein
LGIFLLICVLLCIGAIGQLIEAGECTGLPICGYILSGFLMAALFVFFLTIVAFLLLAYPLLLWRVWKEMNESLVNEYQLLDKPLQEKTSQVSNTIA